MRESVISKICCPACRGSLVLKEAVHRNNQIWEGNLSCIRCLSVYPIRKGIPYLVTRDAWTSLQSEMEGWVSIWQKKGMYEHSDPEYGFNMPQAAGPEVTRLFDMALQEMNLQGNETILDLGAGAGWASSHFARRGCEVIAVDIVLDDIFGLGRSWAIMEHANTWFDPICADGSNLPFLPNQFDIVFFFGSLHHFVDFKKVLEQAYKVLKPGGRLIASGEPFISIFVTTYPIGLPLCADWKSSFLGTLCRASACADAPGRRRPTAGRKPMAGDFSRHVGSYQSSSKSEMSRQQLKKLLLALPRDVLIYSNT